MTKNILILWLLLVHGFALLAILDTDLPYRIDRKLGTGLLNPPELSHFYQEMLGSQLQLDGSVEQSSVLFFGDSITQGLNVSAITHPAINYGIGMDTSHGLLNRIAQYTSLNKASHIFIAIGINDLIRTDRSNQAILDKYQLILAELPAATPVTLQAILPVDERIAIRGFNQRIQTINQGIAALAKSHNYSFFDMHKLITNEQGNLKSKLHVGDGLHLSTDGYQHWITQLQIHFKNLQQAQ